MGSGSKGTDRHVYLHGHSFLPALHAQSAPLPLGPASAARLPTHTAPSIPCPAPAVLQLSIDQLDNEGRRVSIYENGGPGAPKEKSPLFTRSMSVSVSKLHHG